MTLTIYTNIDAISLQRNLDKNQVGLARTLKRLSSGLRVSQASDDAAGLAVATRMESQIRGMNQGVRNANDAISAVQTAEGQMAQLTQILQRARELGVQAANGTYQASDRIAMNRELQQALAEFDRIAGSNTFNGRTLLNGTLGTTNYLVGADASDTISFDWDSNLRLNQQGALDMVGSADLRTSSGAFQFAGTYTTLPISNLDFSIPASPFVGGAITTAGTPVLNYAVGPPTLFAVDGTTVSLSANYASLAALTTAVQAQLSAAHGGWYSVSHDGSTISITKTASAASATTAVSIAAISGANGAAFTSGAPSAGAAAVTATYAGFSIDGHAVYINSNYTGNDAGLLADIQSQLDAIPAITGTYQISGSASGISIAKPASLVTPSVGGFVGTGASTFAQATPAVLTLGAGDFELQMGSGSVVSITGSFASPEALAVAIMSKVPSVYASVDTTSGVMKLLSSQAFTVSGVQADASGALGFSANTSQSSGDLSQVNLFNASSAGEVIMRVDAALDSVNQTRASLGAFQNRLYAVISTLQNSSDNLTMARGRIIDADYAQEMSHLSRRQIVQQAGLALLTQATQYPRTVLALIR